MRNIKKVYLQNQKFLFQDSTFLYVYVSSYVGVLWWPMDVKYLATMHVLPMCDV